MAIPEVLKVFEEYTSAETIPSRFIDLQHLRLVEIREMRESFRSTIESISEVDIERHTSYANQRREDVIRTIVQGVVKYATLTHTWLQSESDPEFQYSHMTSDADRTGAGWNKLERFCGIARDSFGCQFAWADMACINTLAPNQADRQLATQHLFDWFRNAYVCIAYLADASSPLDMGGDRWFSRGFPLTELLAPMRMKFYGRGWRALNNDYIENDKADEGFLEKLSEASGIPTADLRTFWPGPDRIREKLSWASRRETTKVEDRAYSLMAIFNSRIQINYGEGERAFTRLMLDVIPKSGECDVFAWAGERSPHHPGIALSPSGFGKQCCDPLLKPTRYHYRLCGDRSLSVEFGRLCIRAIILEITLQSVGVADYKPSLRRRSPASISEVTLLCPLAPYVAANMEMAIGVLDYDWTNNPDRGKLDKDGRYFGFLLYRRSKTEGWKKLLTKKVVFLANEQELVQDLESLSIC